MATSQIALVNIKASETDTPYIGVDEDVCIHLTDKTEGTYYIMSKTSTDTVKNALVKYKGEIIVIGSKGSLGVINRKGFELMIASHNPVLQFCKLKGNTLIIW